MTQKVRMSGSHYFESLPDVASDRRVIPVSLPDISFELTTDTGVFSRQHLDPATRILLEQAPPPRVRGPILDLGCGYGAIAIAWALRRKRASVWGVDVNTRALDLANLNARALNLGNVQAVLPDQVPGDVEFAAIYSNPPIRVGKEALHGLLGRWIGRLAPNGSAFLVVQRNLGADSLAKWLDNEGYPTVRLGSVKGYRILEARPRHEDSGCDSERGGE
jgi:16S rRNA (guanine1207-N2)-methyltransferase